MCAAFGERELKGVYLNGVYMCVVCINVTSHMHPSSHVM